MDKKLAVLGFIYLMWV